MIPIPVTNVMVNVHLLDDTPSAKSGPALLNLLLLPDQPRQYARINAGDFHRIDVERWDLVAQLDE